MEYQNHQPQHHSPQAAPKGKGMAIIAMILGIASIPFPWIFPTVFWLGLPLAIAGLILSVIARKQLKSRGASSGMAVAGIVCSCVGLLVMIIFVACVAIAACAVGSAIGGNELNDLLSSFR